MKKVMDKEPKAEKIDDIKKIREGVSHNLSHFLFKARNTGIYAEENLADGISYLKELRTKASNEDNLRRIESILEKLNSIDINLIVDSSLLDAIQNDLDEIRIHGWI
jgi:hypothetical protein